MNNETPSARIPNFERAVIDPRKITHYLLNPDHERGGSKAGFFLAFGFRLEQPEILAAALREHAAVLKPFVGPHPYGMRYVVQGPIAAPDGRRPIIRSVWLVDYLGDAPRFVTAHPAEGR